MLTPVRIINVLTPARTIDVLTPVRVVDGLTSVRIVNCVDAGMERHGGVYTSSARKIGERPKTRRKVQEELVFQKLILADEDAK